MIFLLIVACVWLEGNSWKSWFENKGVSKKYVVSSKTITCWGVTEHYTYYNDGSYAMRRYSNGRLIASY